MFPRILNLSKSLGKYENAFLFGPRGTGKSTLARTWLESETNSIEIDLLKGELFRRYATRPEQIREDVKEAIERSNSETLTVFIDEVQKLPALLDEVHSLIETYQQKVRFLLSGSSARKLKRDGANLLGGRAISLKLHPLCTLETEISLHRALQYGTLPVIYKAEDPSARLKSYTETYLKEEILQEALIRKAEPFIVFLDLVGQIIGQSFQLKKLANQCGVSEKTLKVYFDILCDTLIAFRIPAYSHSVRRQLIHTPKYYLFDCGVLNALSGELNTELRPGTYRYGHLFENFIVTEMIRINDYLNKDFKFYHWRTYQGEEIDLVLSRGAFGKPIAVEIKSEQSPNSFRVLENFLDEHPDSKAYCLCNTPLAYKTERVTVLPWVSGIREVLESG